MRALKLRVGKVDVPAILSSMPMQKVWVEADRPGRRELKDHTEARGDAETFTNEARTGLAARTVKAPTRGRCDP